MKIQRDKNDMAQNPLYAPKVFDFDEDSIVSNSLNQRKEEGEETNGAASQGATMNSGVEEKIVEISQETSTGGVKPKKQRRLSSRELMRDQGMHPVKDVETITLPIGEGSTPTPIEMQKNSHWSKLKNSVLATNGFKAGRKKRARRNSATRETVDEIALPPHWEIVYDDAEESQYYYNSETEESSWERPEE